MGDSPNALSLKLPDFDDVLTQFHLNFLKCQKLGVVTPLHPWFDTSLQA